MDNTHLEKPRLIPKVSNSVTIMYEMTNQQDKN